MARPMPLDAPVTIAVRPFKGQSVVFMLVVLSCSYLKFTKNVHNVNFMKPLVTAIRLYVPFSSK